MNTQPKKIALAVVLLAAGMAAGWGLATWRAPSHTGTDAAAAAAPAASAERQVLYWYDPMKPDMKFDKPGKSPYMDMPLQPKYADEAGGGAAAGGVAVSPQAVQALGLRVATAEKQTLATTVDAVGTVQLNERDVSIVQARANGFVERVYARAPGDVIAAGAPLADVLHPEWLAAQQEYLAVRATGDAALTAAARQRLVLLGIPAGLVERVERENRPVATTTITTPGGGLIAELMVRQGMTVAPGMTLARINGLSTVWVEAALPEVQASSVVIGQPASVRLAAAPGEALRGKVLAVLAEANAETRTLRVRIELPNPGQRLRAGMFAQVQLQGGAQGEAVTVPAEAVIRTGRRALVYVVDAPGRYRPVEVELGPEVGERIAVRRGIEAGQQVVASGQFLIDSEASLRGIVAQAAAGTAPAPAALAAPPGHEGAHGAAPMAAATPKATQPAAAAPSYETRGKVVEVDGNTITLDHQAVPALKWPPMTMPFKLERPGLARGLKGEDPVRFSFRMQGDEAVVTAIARDGAAPAKPAAAPVPAQDAHAGHDSHAGHGTGSER
ncbi:efflux RND transporter periplasmic adaptor subunit [Azohydromonas lata]|uniref:Efflux RND transporter periplasmic adaptor subunit n=1 Tax=Azohydromonas lata TaxID=45677 RepID=A0ABU5I972_9BURK|nr:efflux RND transporter periplasmic adaptor subunit [Azohydromonas lata]MDZ5455650.1 efflux RND transporter periplasmic adaptor subunit [Azohydromonas lata]